MNVRAYTGDAGARSIIARQRLVELKGGNLFLRQANVTPEVAPSGVVDAETTVSNGALGISPFDKDSCVHDANNCAKPGITGGYCYVLTATPTWSDGSSTGPTCIGTTEVGTIDKSHLFSFTAPPEEGNYAVDISLMVPGTQQIGTFTRSVTVTEEAGERPGTGEACKDNSDCPVGQVCKSGQCRECGAIDSLLNPGQCGPAATLQSLPSAIILLALLAVVLKFGGD